MCSCQRGLECTDYLDLYLIREKELSSLRKLGAERALDTVLCKTLIFQY